MRQSIIIFSFRLSFKPTKRIVSTFLVNLHKHAEAKGTSTKSVPTYTTQSQCTQMKYHCVKFPHLF